MMKVQVDRRTWLRGIDSGMFLEGENSYLLRGSDGKMCCLGFVCLNCGVDRSDMENIREPDRLSGQYDDIEDILVDHAHNHLPHIPDMILVNDEHNISDEVREAKLTALAKQLGTFEFEFIN